MSALQSILEDFEPGPGGANGGEDVRTQQLKAAAYAEGFSAGEAAAKAKYEANAAFLAEATGQIGQVLQGLPDHLAEQLGEALGAILHKTLPTLAQKGFAEEAVAAVVKHIDMDNCGSLLVKTSPECVDELTAAFAALGDEERFCIEADAAFAGSMVTASWERAGLEMNIEAVVQGTFETFDKYLSHAKEEK